MNQGVNSVIRQETTNVRNNLEEEFYKRHIIKEKLI